MVQFTMARFVPMCLLVVMSAFATTTPTTITTATSTTTADVATITNTTTAATAATATATPTTATSTTAAAEEEEEEEEGEEKAPEKQNFVLGIAMIGILVLAMGMWYLVHAHDPDIRETGWTIISSTISIFVAVLMFSFTSGFFEVLVLGHQGNFEAKRYMNQAFVVFWYGVLLTSCMFSTKVGWFGTPKLRKEISEEPNKMFHIKAAAACSLLWAHCAGFAGMEGWGMVMTTKLGDRHYYESPSNAAMLVPQAFGKWFLILTCLKAFRDSVLAGRVIFFEKPKGEKEETALVELDAKEEEDEDEDELVEMFKETIEDGENDIYGLFVSFLIVQTIRFAATGSLPNKKGVDEEIWDHTRADFIRLLISGVLCLFSSVVIEVVWQYLMVCFVDSKDCSQVRKILNHTCRRLKDIFINFSTMTFAWCFMYSVQMGIAISGLAQKDEAILQVMLATGATICCFGGIRILDMVADYSENLDEHDSSHGLDKEAQNKLLLHRLRLLPRSLMKCNAFIIGFSWESAFDTGVEGISGEFPGKVMQSVVMLVIGVICCVVILPAWYYFIVPMITENGHKLNVVFYQLEMQIQQGFDNEASAEDMDEHKKHVAELLKTVLRAARVKGGLTREDIDKALRESGEDSKEEYTPPLL